MSIQAERKRRARTIQWLARHGAAEGRDWRWGTPAEWDMPAVVDLGREVAIHEKIVPRDKTALPIMINSSGVRLIGGSGTAGQMGNGKRFPAEMPFAVWPETGLPESALMLPSDFN